MLSSCAVKKYMLNTFLTYKTRLGEFTVIDSPEGSVVLTSFPEYRKRNPLQAFKNA